MSFHLRYQSFTSLLTHFDHSVHFTPLLLILPPRLAILFTLSPRWSFCEQSVGICSFLSPIFNNYTKTATSQQPKRSAAPMAAICYSHLFDIEENDRLLGCPRGLRVSNGGPGHQWKGVQGGRNCYHAPVELVSAPWTLETPDPDQVPIDQDAKLCWLIISRLLYF